MKRLTQEQIEEIKKAVKEGGKIKTIARRFNVHPNTVLYHTSNKFRERLRRYNRERYQRMSEETKKEYFEKKRAYQKEYQKNKYKNDPEFRRRQLERAKEYQKRTYVKKSEEGKR